MSNPRYANGHRRRRRRAELLAQGARCVWAGCRWPGDWLGLSMTQTLSHLDDRFPVVDEIIPIKYGGSPTAADNTRLLHRWCNAQRGAGREPKTIVVQESTPRPPITSSPGWGPSR